MLWSYRNPQNQRTFEEIARNLNLAVSKGDLFSGARRTLYHAGIDLYDGSRRLTGMEREDEQPHFYSYTSNGKEARAVRMISPHDALYFLHHGIIDAAIGVGFDIIGEKTILNNNHVKLPDGKNVEEMRDYILSVKYCPKFGESDYQVQLLSDTGKPECEENCTQIVPLVHLGYKKSGYYFVTYPNGFGSMKDFIEEYKDGMRSATEKKYIHLFRHFLDRVGLRADPLHKVERSVEGLLVSPYRGSNGNGRAVDSIGCIVEKGSKIGEYNLRALELIQASTPWAIARKEVVENPEKTQYLEDLRRILEEGANIYEEKESQAFKAKHEFVLR